MCELCDGSSTIYCAELSSYGHHQLSFAFFLQATVSLSDGTPAPHLPVRFSTNVVGGTSPDNTEVNSNDEGLVAYRINVSPAATTITCTVDAPTRRGKNYRSEKGGVEEG